MEEATMSREVMTGTSRSAGVLPAWESVLAVVAHPDDESFGLGALLAAFTGAGTRVEVLCLTQGEAPMLHEASGELASLRGAELAAAGDALGVTHTTLHHHPDGALSDLCRTKLATEVVVAADASNADGLLVFDTAGVTGHLDHVAANAASLLAAETLNLPVLGWALPETVAAQLNQEFGASFTGRRDEDIDLRVTVDRAHQRVACHAHASEALPGSMLWRRLELLADTESLRWLRPPGGAAGHPATLAPLAARFDAAEGRPMRVEHRGGDQFDINVRGHVISVDQPVKDGGDDTAPTPTELFIASLASCVAFNARRYLARHNLPTDGLAVEATFDMDARPARDFRIDLRLILPGGVPAERRDPLLAVARHCTVHNTLAPEVSITLADAPAGKRVGGLISGREDRHRGVPSTTGRAQGPA
jgi:N-acetylglucosamine malate deacetylase 2